MADDEQGFRPVGDVITLCPMSELHRIGRTLTHPIPPPPFVCPLFDVPSLDPADFTEREKERYRDDGP